MRPVLEDARPRRAASRSPRSGSAPIREASVRRCARSTVEIESSCTAPSRRISSATSAARARRGARRVALVRDDVAAELRRAETVSSSRVGSSGRRYGGARDPAPRRCSLVARPRSAVSGVLFAWAPFAIDGSPDAVRRDRRARRLRRRGCRSRCGFFHARRRADARDLARPARRGRASASAGCRRRTRSASAAQPYSTRGEARAIARVRARARHWRSVVDRQLALPPLPAADASSHRCTGVRLQLVPAHGTWWTGRSDRDRVGEARGRRDDPPARGPQRRVREVLEQVGARERRRPGGPRARRRPRSRGPSGGRTTSSTRLRARRPSASGGCIAAATSSCSASGFLKTRSSRSRSCSEPITSASESSAPLRTTGELRDRVALHQRRSPRRPSGAPRS